MTLKFTDCENGTLSYNFTASGLSGEAALARIANDNVPLCNALAEPGD